MGLEYSPCSSISVLLLDPLRRCRSCSRALASSPGARIESIWNLYPNIYYFRFFFDLPSPGAGATTGGVDPPSLPASAFDSPPETSMLPKDASLACISAWFCCTSAAISGSIMERSLGRPNMERAAMAIMRICSEGRTVSKGPRNA